MEQIIWGHPFGSGLDCSFYYELDTPGLKTEKRVQEKAVFSAAKFHFLFILGVLFDCKVVR